MICPQCRAEYRQGYTSCSECQVPLVEPRGDELQIAEPAAEVGDPNQDPFCSFWKGGDLRVATEICAVLDEVCIPHKTIRRQDHLFNFSNQSPYEIGVPASSYKKAEQAIQEAFGTDEETGEERMPLLPEPESRRTDSLELPEAAMVDVNEWLGPQYPEDATVQVWSGEDQASKDMIEMSLKENNLTSRSERDGDLVRVLVLPEDQERAREIVREIVEGTPPE
jgi:hypothetical protein